MAEEEGAEPFGDPTARDVGLDLVGDLVESGACGVELNFANSFQRSFQWARARPATGERK